MSIVTETSLLEHALAYHAAGFSVIPLKRGTKKPVIRGWKKYQTERATEAKIREWFSSEKHGIGIICGPVSGGLCVIDFDEANAYQKWADQNPEQAENQPTVKTHRGFHIYGRVAASDLMKVRQSIGKPNGTGAILYKWGEIRGEGCYIVAPPSLHPSGSRYQWENGPKFPLPIVRLDWFINCHTAYTASAAHTGKRKQPQQTQAIGAVCDGDESKISDQIEAAIIKTIPTRTGTRNKKIFEFVRELKSIPQLAQKPIADFEPIARRWHLQAIPNIRTKAWDETWLDFVTAWENARFPAGESVLQQAAKKARENPLPEVAKKFDRPETRLLVALCAGIQREAGEGTFFLSSRDAAQYAGFDHHKQASRFLKLFCKTGILECVKTGTLEGRQASEYRYLPSLD